MGLEIDSVVYRIEILNVYAVFATIRLRICLYILDKNMVALCGFEDVLSAAA
jgi:hypothetical protein